MAAVCACFFDLQDLVDLMALSTLLVFALVAACIIVLRYRPEEDISSSGESGEVTGLLAGVSQNQLTNLSDSADSQPSLLQMLFQRNNPATPKSGSLVTWITSLFSQFFHI